MKKKNYIQKKASVILWIYTRVEKIKMLLITPKEKRDSSVTAAPGKRRKTLININIKEQRVWYVSLFLSFDIERKSSKHGTLCW